MRTFLPSLFRKVGALVVFGHALASGRGTLCAESDASSPAVFVISVPDQQLAVIHGDRISATFPVSTSKFGLGDAFGSYKTPLGLLQICEKIGGHLPLGAVIKKRCATGEIIFPNASGRDAVVSRIKRNDRCRVSDAGVAGGGVKCIAQRRLRQLPRQRMFASAAADQQDVHGRKYTP